VGANEERTDGSSRESAGAAVGSSEVFDRHRPLLFSIAYRMLGSVMDAEDVVQEAYLRWQWASATEVRSPKAYLSSVVTRLCIDQSRSARTQREKYVGPWLPELLPTEPAPDAPAIDETLSMAFLVLLESLNPTERAVFLLREVFDYDYHEISHLVGKSEAECRQIARRARQSVAARRPRFERSPEQEELRETSGQSASWSSRRNSGPWPRCLKSKGGREMIAPEILVTGGTGTLGRRVDRLREAGREVRVLSRSGRPGTIRGRPLDGGEPRSGSQGSGHYSPLRLQSPQATLDGRRRHGASPARGSAGRCFARRLHLHSRRGPKPVLSLLPGEARRRTGDRTLPGAVDHPKGYPVPRSRANGFDEERMAPGWPVGAGGICAEEVDDGMDRGRIRARGRCCGTWLPIKFPHTAKSSPAPGFVGFPTSCACW
jgi:RNA polymerase sigma factor (sigma-70 family)